MQKSIQKYSLIFPGVFSSKILNILSSFVFHYAMLDKRQNTLPTKNSPVPLEYMKLM